MMCFVWLSVEGLFACTGSETCCASSEAYRQCSLRRHVMLGFHVEKLRSRFDNTDGQRGPLVWTEVHFNATDIAAETGAVRRLRW